MRLTHYDEHKKRWQINDDHGAVMIDELNYAVGEAIDKLAAYEDTGIEPEEIEDRQDVCLWIPEDRFAEIINAEADGRLVVFPCKVGDTVYEIDLPEYGVIVCNVLCFTYGRSNITGDLTWSVAVNVIGGHGFGSCYTFDPDDFGNTVFLSRAEAEAALKKEDKA